MATSVDLSKKAGTNPISNLATNKAGSELFSHAQPKGLGLQQTQLPALNPVGLPSHADGKAVLARLQAEGQVSSALQNVSLLVEEGNPATSVGRSLLESINNAQPARPALPVVEIPLNDSRWGAAVAQRAVVAIQQGLQQAEVRITPAHLGPIEMHIQLQEDKASVTMISPHAAVRELLDAATPRLRELLEEQGMSLEQNLVSDESPDSREFAEAGSDNENQIGQASDLDDGQQQSEQVRRQLGLIDHYA